ncbi:MAG: hypothetical protein HFF10_01750 [Angelakisella sp.]|jgi:hypothetical protein|nr:hypothetical protein [Angelakisella sp.]
MIADIKSTGSCYKRTGKVYWPLFRREVKVSFGMNADVSTEYAEKCVSQLLDLDHSGVEQLLQASVRFFYDAERCYGEPLPFLFEFENMEYPKELNVPTNILPYIIPVEMYVDKEIPNCFSISLFAECAWEPEHGLQWVVRNGRPLYVGGYDGLGSHSDENIYLENWKESNYLFDHSG